MLLTCNRLDCSNAALRVLAPQMQVIPGAIVVVIVAVSRSLVCNNLITRAGYSRTASVYLDDAQVPHPEIIVTGNVIEGSASIVPERYPASAQVPPPMNSWDFLNTIVP